MFPFIPNPMVEGLRLPERLAGAAEQPVGFAGGEPFPALDNGAERVVGDRPEDGVDMVRHHHPRSEMIPLAVEVPERVHREFGDLRATQPAFADAGAVWCAVRC